MQTITFSMPVNLETGHPDYFLPALWIGRAIIAQETDAEITDLFFLPDAAAEISTARRVEVPDNSKAGYAFRYRLEQAAITAYHNPQLQPAEMPDEDYSWRVCDVKAMSDAINPAKP